MCKWKVFEPGFKFTTTCVFTGAQHEHTVVSRDGDHIVCDALHHECDGIHHVQVEYDVLKGPSGKEYIVVSEYKGEEIIKYADESVCSYESCLKCEISECTTGQIARVLGKDVYDEFVEAYRNFMCASELMEKIEKQLEDTVSKIGKKLVEFEVKGEHYIVYGNYVIEQGTYYNDEQQKSATYDYPEFDSLTAKIVKDGKEIDFSPSGATWPGRKYEVCDMIQDFLSKQILHSKLYEAVYIEKGLQELIDWYHRDIATVYQLIQIPKKILSNDMHNLYELELVTNEYIYYMYEDLCLMLNAENHEVVSDNYFASEGYFESIENIKNGKSNEKLIWGHIPEEL